MDLKNFSVASDNISIQQAGNNYDLHNCFDFTSFNYDQQKHRIELIWQKCNGDWVPVSTPQNLKIVFEGVHIFKTQERDRDYPTGDKECLSSIGFIWNDLIEDMDSFFTHSPQEDCSHLNIHFESGFALKIAAKSGIMSLIPDT